jgi:hypothetical protein
VDGPERAPEGEGHPPALVRPYAHPMPPLALPPLARLLFGDDGDGIRHAVTDPERPPRHRRPGPAVTGPGLPPR